MIILTTSLKFKKLTKNQSRFKWEASVKYLAPSGEIEVFTYRGDSKTQATASCIDALWSLYHSGSLKSLFEAKNAEDAIKALRKKEPSLVSIEEIKEG